jgi:UDP-GlcNAc:undecaprenyl-phosphate GlcNAc-1-phosphate transferase
MLTLIIIGVCGLLASLILTRFCRDFFAFLEMVDHPGGPRKLHLRPIPRVGGISIAISYFFALTSILIVSSYWKHLLAESGLNLGLLWRLLPALAIIFLTGLVDDFWGLTPWQKIGGQVLAAGAAFGAGIQFSPSPDHPAAIYWSLPATIVWLVFCANAFNLIDGLDGLASGLALLGASGLLLAAALNHQPILALAIVPFLGVLLGFLYYNFNPASVFLGDGGSLLIGFLVGCFGLIWNPRAMSGLGPFMPLLIVAVPAADVGISIMRRFLRRQPIFRADRNHIHHRLLSLGMTDRNAALTLYGASALGVTLAVLQTIVHPHAALALIGLCAVAAYVGVSRLGYVEFRSIRNAIHSGELLGILRMRICLNEYQESLAAARNLEQCWEAVATVCRAAGFRRVTFEMEGKRFEFAEAPMPAEYGSRMVIPVLDRAKITFVQQARASASAMWIAPIVEALSENLTIERCAETSSASDKPMDDLTAVTAGAR